MVSAARIAKKGMLDAEDEEDNKKKDDSSSTSSDTLDYIRLRDDDEDNNNGNDDETVLIRLDPSVSALVDHDHEDNIDPILDDEQQASEDSDFQLSDLLSWEEDSNVFEEDDVSSSDSSSRESFDGSSDDEPAEDVVLSLNNSLEPTALPSNKNNEENSLDEELSWSLSSQDEEVPPIS